MKRSAIDRLEQEGYSQGGALLPLPKAIARYRELTALVEQEELHAQQQKAARKAKRIVRSDSRQKLLEERRQRVANTKVEREARRVQKEADQAAKREEKKRAKEAKEQLQKQKGWLKRATRKTLAYRAERSRWWLHVDVLREEVFLRLPTSATYVQIRPRY